MPNFNQHAAYGIVSSLTVNYIIVQNFSWGVLIAGCIGGILPDQIEPSKYFGHYNHRGIFHSKRVLIVLIPLIAIFGLVYYFFLSADSCRVHCNRSPFVFFD